MFYISEYVLNNNLSSQIENIDIIENKIKYVLSRINTFFLQDNFIQQYEKLSKIANYDLAQFTTDQQIKIQNKKLFNSINCNLYYLIKNKLINYTDFDPNSENNISLKNYISNNIPNFFMVRMHKQKENYSLRIFNDVIEFFNNNKELFNEALKLFDESKQAYNSCNINFKILTNVLNNLINNLPESTCCIIKPNLKEKRIVNITIQNFIINEIKIYTIELNKYLSNLYKIEEKIEPYINSLNTNKNKISKHSLSIKEFYKQEENTKRKENNFITQI